VARRASAVLATKAWMEKTKRTPKFEVRRKHRCRICGRSRAYLRQFAMCRMCFRHQAHRGLIPGIKKASW